MHSLWKATVSWTLPWGGPGWPVVTGRCVATAPVAILCCEDNVPEPGREMLPAPKHLLKTPGLICICSCAPNGRGISAGPTAALGCRRERLPAGHLFPQGMAWVASICSYLGLVILQSEVRAAAVAPGGAGVWVPGGMGPR